MFIASLWRNTDKGRHGSNREREQQDVLKTSETTWDWEVFLVLAGDAACLAWDPGSSPSQSPAALPANLT